MANLMVIARGVSGSGKSTMVDTLYSHGVILSTDDLWMSRGNEPEYLWNSGGLGMAHTLNKMKCQEACSRSEPLVVIDNTNTEFWELEPYVQIAIQFDYMVQVVQPDNEWSFDAEKCFEKNAHGVPLEVIQSQLQRFQSIESVQQKIENLMEA